MNTVNTKTKKNGIASHRSNRLSIATALASLAIAAVTGCHSTPPSSSSAAPASTPTRVAIVLTNHGQLGDTGKPTGFYLSEATHPYEVFHASGYEIDFVSPKGGLAPMDGVDASDPINAAFLADESLVARTKQTTPIAAVDPARYDAVFFSGGHGTMWDFPDDPGVQALIRAVYERGGVVAAVCHGPAAIVNARLSDGSYLVKGKEVSAFTDEEETAVALETVVPFALESTLRERGAIFVEAPNFEKKVAVSERLVTGQNPASATGVAEAVVVLLEQDGSRR
jgi:putative intracellular protease/amidase